MRIRHFLAELLKRVAPVSAAMMAGALLRMMCVLAPECDWALLAQACRNLKRNAKPSRNKAERVVPARDIYGLELDLMFTAADAHTHPRFRATQYRDGLMIAMLICCPVRLKNFTGIKVGHHLQARENGYWLQLTPAETKSGRPYAAPYPRELIPRIDCYLEVHRCQLQQVAREWSEVSTSGQLWLDRWGRPMSSKAIRAQIKCRTRVAFGRPLWPHLFRDCAVTELVDNAPDQIGIASDILGHLSLQTTQKHYIQACGMVAHQRLQDVLAARRRAAKAQAKWGRRCGCDGAGATARSSRQSSNDR